MPKPRDEVGISSEKPLSKEEFEIVKFLENKYETAYTKEDIIEKFPDINRALIPVLLESLTRDKIISAKSEKDFRERETRYYMAKKR